jgi:hypothetical protein
VFSRRQATDRQRSAMFFITAVIYRNDYRRSVIESDTHCTAVILLCMQHRDGGKKGDDEKADPFHNIRVSLGLYTGIKVKSMFMRQPRICVF